MSIRVSRGRVFPALLLLLAGCAGIPDTVSEMPPGQESIELAGTPFYAQERYQCGPAALTTVLEASGADVRLEDMVRKVYLPGRRGSLQIELLAATRTSGRMPYRIDATLAAIVNELGAGRPVLVLQNLGIGLIPRWHYAVVIGIDAERRRMILRSGTDRRRETPISVFLKTWARGDYWGIVALEPGDLPANADRSRFLEQAAALEQIGRSADALAAWRAAIERWPGDGVALFGRANAQLALEDYAAAEQAYRELLARRPGLTAARNNLALAIARQGRTDAALAEIDRAIAMNRDETLATTLAETRVEILSAGD